MFLKSFMFKYREGKKWKRGTLSISRQAFSLLSGMSFRQKSYKIHWWIFYKDLGPPPWQKNSSWQKLGGKSSKLAIFNRILTLISYFFSNFQLNPNIFCQFFLTMSSSIQFFIKIDVFFQNLVGKKWCGPWHKICFFVKYSPVWWG